MIPLALAVLLLVVGTAGARADEVDAAKRAVLSLLNQPDSAQFRNVNVSRLDPRMVCGWVNVKDGLPGERRFVYSTTDNRAFILEMSLSDPQGAVEALRLIEHACPL
jgi:hypothetical protein